MTAGELGARRARDSWLLAALRGPLLALCVDLMVIVGATLTAHLSDNPRLSTVQPLVWVTAIVGTWVVVAYALLAYDDLVLASPRRSVPRALTVAAVSVGLCALLPEGASPLPSSRRGLALYVFFLGGGLASWRSIFALLLVGGCSHSNHHSREGKLLGADR